MNPISHNHYLRLPEGMFAAATPVATSNPRLLLLNDGVVQEYGLTDGWLRTAEALGVLSGTAVDRQNPPIAMAYSGHQFGRFVPLLGDGRAHLLGQMHTDIGAVDVQLKGSGVTVYSRGGDGRATLASVLREYVVSESMAGLGIPTTRSLAVIASGQSVYRDQPEAGGILVRTARSHIRVGSFQHAAGNLGDDAVKALADHVIEQYFPQHVDEQDRYANLLLSISQRQAKLIAQWMQVGFIHGVMNTDNMSVVGETIDFGPCAFMDEFNPDKVFSSIDRRGRYAWARQPEIGLWNLMRLAETLLPLLSDDSDSAIKIAEAQLVKFMPAFQAAFYAGLRNKLGLADQGDAANELADQTLALLGQHTIDMTVFFDTLTRVAGGEPEQALLDLFADQAVAQQWLAQWHELRVDDDSAQAMRLVNPAVIARNHRVEEALQAAATRNDLAPFLRLTKALKTPFDCAPEDAELQVPPSPEERVTATFCGT